MGQNRVINCRVLGGGPETRTDHGPDGDRNLNLAAEHVAQLGSLIEQLIQTHTHESDKHQLRHWASASVSWFNGNWIDAVLSQWARGSVLTSHLPAPCPPPDELRRTLGIVGGTCTIPQIRMNCSRSLTSTFQLGIRIVTWSTLIKVVIHPNISVNRVPWRQQVQMLFAHGMQADGSHQLFGILPGWEASRSGRLVARSLTGASCKARNLALFVTDCRAGFDEGLVASANKMPNTRS